MLEGELLGLKLDVAAKEIALDCIDPVVEQTPPARLVGQVRRYGQTAYLTVLENPAGRYIVLSDDLIYSAMRRVRAEDNSKFAAVDCLLVIGDALSEVHRELIIAYHAYELVPSLANKLRIADLMCALSSQGEIVSNQLTTVLAKLLGKSPRHARTLVAVSSRAIPAVREAMLTKGKGHIDDQTAAAIAGFPREEQATRLAEFQAKAGERKLADQRKQAARWMQQVKKRLETGASLPEADAKLLEEARQLIQSSDARE